MNLLSVALTFLENRFSFLFTAVTSIFNTILSEIPDDEIAILHGAMATAASSLKAGKTVEQSYTAALNYIAAQEKQELSKLGDQLLQAFITATAPASASTAPAPTTL